MKVGYCWKHIQQGSIMSEKSKLYYTKTDEAPMLATASFLPIVKAFTSTSDIDIELKDISLAARIKANLSSYLKDDQKVDDALSELGELAKSPEANIVKLPNISASIPQLKEAIEELKSQGFGLPDFPESPQNDEEREIKALYSKVLGSAVNPVLREGNSDRRVATPVKEFAKNNPHSMGAWEKSSKSHVAHMKENDFYGSEQSVAIAENMDVSIVLETKSGEKKVLKEKLALLKGEVIDSSCMSVGSLREFFESEMEDAKKNDVLFSLHMKATMMKVSDPIIFGHCVEVFFKDAFEKHGETFKKIGVNCRNGLGDVYQKISGLPEDQKKEIETDLANCYKTRPRLAMVDSDKGITNLHVPSDVIIDASMPAAIRTSGQMWGTDGKLHDMKAVIPDRSYAGIYQETISFCRDNGAFDPKSMGNVANVGLMAKKAEEYGSHDKTFCLEEDGVMKVLDPSGKALMEHTVLAGDIWRMCQTKDEAIKDWVKLGVKRAKATGNPGIFWLDESRAHDRTLIEKVNTYLGDHDCTGLEIKILSPVLACQYSLQRVKEGVDTISITGNVLRDYLTDLFPILELGTSAKMLSIVPLLAGGGLYETGAGGSAPKHVQQFIKENHLRWDSLGEFLALAVSLEELGEKSGNDMIKALGAGLDKANSVFLANNKSPSRKVNELDNRGSHFYLSLYWARALSEQEESKKLKTLFTPIAEELANNEEQVIKELNSAQGGALDIGGYYHADQAKIDQAMRPSETFNSILAKLS
jgi:isocitrate dehydrogenase